MSTLTASQAWLFHGLHPLHVFIYLDCFTVLTVSQSQHFVCTLIMAAEGISAFNAVLVNFEFHMHILCATVWKPMDFFFLGGGIKSKILRVFLCVYLYDVVSRGPFKQYLNSIPCRVKCWLKSFIQSQTSTATQMCFLEVVVHECLSMVTNLQ